MPASPVSFLTLIVYKWADLVVKTSDGKESRKILEGTSDHFEYFEMHATTQFKGAKTPDYNTTSAAPSFIG